MTRVRGAEERIGAVREFARWRRGAGFSGRGSRIGREGLRGSGGMFGRDWRRLWIWSVKRFRSAGESMPRVSKSVGERFRKVVAVIGAAWKRGVKRDSPA